MFMRTLSCLMVSFAAIWPAAFAHAQSYPTGPITIVAPFPAGGTPDLVARVIADKASSIMGVPMVVEAKPGGQSITGTTTVANARPDGHTWLLATLSFVTSPVLVKGVSWDPVKSFRGIAQLATAPVVAVVPASLGVTTLRDFVAKAKQAPGKLNYLMPGVGTSMHLNTEMLKKSAGIDLFAIPYKGTPLGMPELLKGELSFAMLPLSTALPYLKDGKLTALAVVAPERVSEIPDVPTLKEAGFPEAQVLSWYAMVAPAGTPDEAVAVANKALNQAIADPGVKQRLRDLGVYVTQSNTAAQTDTLLRGEAERWKQTLRAMNLQAQ
ncbi:MULTISPECIES: tripartite tricarboxylate transporter substrate binding protein [Hydrogenophaga]|uniref:Tripartite tricarboxylate transporter substrate binding protein n=1 Tax=Hydrogenophaga borbori TaxID=2294117 RepID=A0A372EDK9_9BURK|nr:MULTISPECIES: tripartite tricarboxylate transporter substrate binding protein [Hydrogenophaga]RFP75508.1 tripartite tricarboxylate transporter substrate binding protein [Hydrogenophaga borbori]